MPTSESRPGTMRGSITPPLPSPPMTAFSRSIAWTTLASPTGVRMTRPPYLAATSSSMRLVERFAAATAARLLRQDVAARPAPANIPRRCRCRSRRRSPAGRRPGPGRSRRGACCRRTSSARPGEVLRRRLGLVGELAVGRAVEVDELAAELGQQRRRRDAAGPVHAVQHDLEPLARDPQHVHVVEHALDVQRVRLACSASAAPSSLARGTYVASSPLVDKAALICSAPAPAAGRRVAR